jgi:2-polyprenyl-6-methoxyphenol hydroxylase-like FAD-dependent oxidoreductase
VLPEATVRTRSADAARLYEQCIADTPVVAELLRNACREWPIRVEKDFSFSSRAYAGDRWVVAGDAGSFLDPIFSTGVAIALESGLEAAQAVSQGLASGDLSAARFTRFARRQRQRYVSFRRFVLAFYTAEFRDLFFNEQPPKGLFQALVTVFAGYWRPPVQTRFRVWLFFRLVWAQRLFGFAPRFTALKDQACDDKTTSGR